MSKKLYFTKEEILKARCKAQMKYWFAHHEELKVKKREQSKLYYQQNLEKERARSKQKYKDNPGYYICKAKTRKEIIERATPVWANRNEIFEFYKNCPQGYHVDHKIPLRGKNVSGLHIIGNLQYLPQEENLKKGNSFGQVEDPDGAM